MKKEPVIYSDTYCYSPTHYWIKNWVFRFNTNPDDIKVEEPSAYNEAELANCVAKVAEQNGLSPNDMQHAFPIILRILKSNSQWSK